MRRTEKIRDGRRIKLLSKDQDDIYLFIEEQRGLDTDGGVIWISDDHKEYKLLKHLFCILNYTYTNIGKKP